jgi:DNA-binding CsgD family transcriptional regulator
VIVDGRELERRVAMWQNRFLALLHRTPLPSAICKTDGTITIANPAFAAVFGATPARVRGRLLTDLMRPGVRIDYERVLEDLRTRRRTRRTVPVTWDSGAGDATVQVVDDEEGIALFFTLQPHPGPAADRPRLSDREHEVLRLVAGGATSAETAAALGLTADGVNYHLTRLTRRLRVPNRLALIARSYSLGLLDPTTWPPT